MGHADKLHYSYISFMLQYSSNGPDEPVSPQKPSKPNRPNKPTKTSQTTTTTTTTTTTEAYYPEYTEDNYGSSDNVDYLDYEEYDENTNDYTSQDYSVRNADSDYYSEDYSSEETVDYETELENDYSSTDYADQVPATEELEEIQPSVEEQNVGVENEEGVQGCPGGDLETCIDVCPGFNKAAFGFCVAECGQRCP